MEKIGKINIFADIETDAVKQSIQQFEEFLEGQDNIVSAVLLPDCHLGYSIPIGSVFASIGKIYPSAVGYDIGCGMCAIPTTLKVADIRDPKKIFDNIYRDIPVGKNRNKELTKEFLQKAEEILLNHYEIVD